MSQVVVHRCWSVGIRDFRHGMSLTEHPCDPHWFLMRKVLPLTLNQRANHRLACTCDTLDLTEIASHNLTMARMSTFLVLLLLVLTFNAYACLLPPQSASGMDCSSATEQPVRQTCDAFLQLGPQSLASFTEELPTIKVEFHVAPQLPTSVFLVYRTEHPPRGADTPIHLSIPTTVLRI